MNLEAYIAKIFSNLPPHKQIRDAQYEEKKERKKRAVNQLGPLRRERKKVQKMSKKCVSCGNQILRRASATSYRHDEMAHGVSSVTYSGGKISCGHCDVDHRHWCVHGQPMGGTCRDCPDGERIRNAGELTKRYRQT